MRGEHSACRSSASGRRGPSPRARGARRHLRHGYLPLGTIPACAGSTQVSGAHGQLPRDHPRVRGEHISCMQRVLLDAGPSPRARGAPPNSSARGSRRGTIPACAGSTLRGALRAAHRRDHPRVRGEHAAQAAIHWRSPGPSPRARGAHGDNSGRELLLGTIPACAGSTEVSRPWPTSPGDHPRVRGEHPDWQGSDRTGLGPSPRARGAPKMHPDQVVLSGTIPACAGSTPTSAPPARWAGDHPRVRGEHYECRSDAVARGGPSPRARGAPGTARRWWRAGGTIPACAGSTPPTSERATRSGDHPRVRGEHPSTSDTTVSPMGPSPRARGALANVSSIALPWGTIPACAGSTVWSGTPGSRGGDHPRVRGEHDHGQECPRCAPGPSPRARGAPA